MRRKVMFVWSALLVAASHLPHAWRTPHVSYFVRVQRSNAPAQRSQQAVEQQSPIVQQHQFVVLAQLVGKHVVQREAARRNHKKIRRR